MKEWVSQAFITRDAASNSALVEMRQQSATLIIPNMVFVFPLNAIEHARFHEVFRCKEQGYKLVINFMYDTWVQYYWKHVLKSKQNFKPNHFLQHSIFSSKQQICTGSRAQWFISGQKFPAYTSFSMENLTQKQALQSVAKSWQSLSMHWQWHLVGNGIPKYRHV